MQKNKCSMKNKKYCSKNNSSFSIGMGIDLKSALLNVENLHIRVRLHSEGIN
jgi:hypothetical protein